ncbi:DUF4389 domain-containing protein [Teredinibacter turnerae]|uniref:Lipase n=1 Tax=Teredinibacter turnerae (strain ATCC 39867 / T7901) TaxID=377629 RepID=C5BL78_TERTT|nr:DUF4389 domain-containing protein [Teredinibacter turnerae]ACR11644.1 conserved hypothetical protein [Teredinibacter turnerae T7901]
MNEDIKSNLTSSKHWLRLVFMVLFAVFFQVALAVLWVLVCVQFLFALVTGSDNPKLRYFAASLAIYIHGTINFLTYNSEEKPFPFADWPETPSASAEQTVAEHAPEAATAPVTSEGDGAAEERA